MGNVPLKPSISAKPPAPKGRRGESISLAKSIRPHVPAKSHPWKRKRGQK